MQTELCEAVFKKKKQTKQQKENKRNTLSAALTGKLVLHVPLKACSKQATLLYLLTK